MATVALPPAASRFIALPPGAVSRAKILAAALQVRRKLDARGDANNFTVKKDGWIRVKFPEIETAPLRLEVQLQPNFSGGIMEWKIK